MAYEGEVLDACGTINIDFSRTFIVAVSGDGPNVCGHLLVFAAGDTGYYFHVAGVYTYPHYMTEAGYRRYLRETGKHELRRRSVELKNPQGAFLYLENLAAGKWAWLVLPHNCVAFVEAVINAGDGTWSSYTNCPAIATADTVQERIEQFYQTMNNEIYRLYGVPQ